MEMLKRCLQFYNHSLTILESIPTYVMLYAQKSFNLHHVVSLACSMLSRRSYYFGLTPKIQCTILTLSYEGGGGGGEGVGPPPPVFICYS